MLFHHFDRFLTKYESRFEREYGYFQPIVKDMVERYLDCRNPKCGFARIRCPECAGARLAELFGREVPALLVGRELLSPEWAERILSWPHSGFNVHSLVRAKTKPEAERVGKYMLRPILALERLTLKVYEADPMLCPKCGGAMKVVAFITEQTVVDRIIDHLKLTFAAEKPPPARVFEPAALIRRPHGGRRNAALRAADVPRPSVFFS